MAGRVSEWSSSSSSPSGILTLSAFVPLAIPPRSGGRAQERRSGSSRSRGEAACSFDGSRMTIPAPDSRWTHRAEQFEHASHDPGTSITSSLPQTGQAAGSLIGSLAPLAPPFAVPLTVPGMDYGTRVNPSQNPAVPTELRIVRRRPWDAAPEPGQSEWSGRPDSETSAHAPFGEVPRSMAGPSELCQVGGSPASQVGSLGASVSPGSKSTLRIRIVISGY